MCVEFRILDVWKLLYEFLMYVLQPGLPDPHDKRICSVMKDLDYLNNSFTIVLIGKIQENE